MMYRHAVTITLSLAFALETWKLVFTYSPHENICNSVVNNCPQLEWITSPQQELGGACCALESRAPRWCDIPTAWPDNRVVRGLHPRSPKEMPEGAAGSASRVAPVSLGRTQNNCDCIWLRPRNSIHPVSPHPWCWSSQNWQSYEDWQPHAKEYWGGPRGVRSLYCKHLLFPLGKVWLLILGVGHHRGSRLSDQSQATS